MRFAVHCRASGGVSQFAVDLLAWAGVRCRPAWTLALESPALDSRSAGQHKRWISAAKATIRVFYVYVRPGILRFFGKIDTTEL